VKLSSAGPAGNPDVLLEWLGKIVRAR